MDADDLDAAFAGVGGEGDGGPGAVGHIVAADDFSDEGFSGNTEQERAIADTQLVEVFEEFEVVLEVFAKSDAGIETEPLGIDADGGAGGETFFEKIAHFGDDVFVMGGVLHRARVALHVHDDDAALAVGFGQKGQHVRVSAQTGDIVDDVGSGI